MAYNHIVIDDFESEPTVIKPLFQVVRGIVNSKRGSTMRPESRERIQEIRRKEASSNETSFLVHFMSALLQSKRHVLEAIATEPDSEDGQGGSPPVSPLEQYPSVEPESIRTLEIDNSIIPAEKLNRWTERTWDKDGLKVRWCADFTSAAVPRLSGADPLLAAHLARYPRVATPRPDICYGLQNCAFTEAEQLVNSAHSLFACVSKDCFHAFFLVECKLVKIEDAENQIARGGATLVYARRSFNGQDPERACKQKRLGADLESFAFSLVLTPSIARLFLHWAEVAPSLSQSATPPHETVNDIDCRVVYHTTALTNFIFKPPAGVSSFLYGGSPNMNPVEQLRHDINNILDWGTLQRKIEIKEVSKAIAEGVKGEKRGREEEPKPD